MEDIVKAMEHDRTDVPTMDPVEAYKAIEKGVVNTYQKVEKKFVKTFLAKDGESVEDAIKRVSEDFQK